MQLLVFNQKQKQFPMIKARLGLGTAYVRF